MSNGKDLIIHLTVGLIKRHCIKLSQYFPKPYQSFKGNISVKVDLYYYATKTGMKNISHIDASSLK